MKSHTGPEFIRLTSLLGGIGTIEELKSEQTHSQIRRVAAISESVAVAAISVAISESQSPQSQSRSKTAISESQRLF